MSVTQIRAEMEASALTKLIPMNVIVKEVIIKEKTVNCQKHDVKSKSFVRMVVFVWTLFATMTLVKLLLKQIRASAFLDGLARSVKPIWMIVHQTLASMAENALTT